MSIKDVHLPNFPDLHNIVGQATNSFALLVKRQQINKDIVQTNLDYHLNPSNPSAS